MKAILLTLLACLVSTFSWGQVLGSLFSQKQENRKLLAQQIAALEVYKTYIKKGYDIISKGVGLINKIKTGDFNLHRDFFGALKIVNPRIKKYAKVAGLMGISVQAVTRLKQLNKLARSELMSNAEQEFIRQVVQNVLQMLADTIDELILIITDNQLDLKDDERIERIERLYLVALDQGSFVQRFDEQVSLLLRMKKKRQADIRGSDFLNGVTQP
ncbi:hypothetical protein PV783_24980 [Chitinophaga sp. CC14]|uniref:hypothetical protein n=1 Tax=Chitinophaga sp. CC14 TaxID=3029199 RepID=UPI003B7E2ABF